MEDLREHSLPFGTRTTQQRDMDGLALQGKMEAIQLGSPENLVGEQQPIIKLSLGEKRQLLLIELHSAAMVT